MKSLIKKILFYNKIYPILKNSFLYQSRKKFNGQLANSLYGHPSKDFFVIGVTGTNGKTTTVNLLHQILNDNVAKCVSVSTANIRIGEQIIPNKKKMTSLDIYDLQSTLAMAKDSWCKVAVLETSSHGLDQFRFEGVEFDFAVLTNVTLDHLDYHGTMDEYIKAKRKLFDYVIQNTKKNKYASLPMDDKVGRQRFDEMPFDKKIGRSIQWSSSLKAENIVEKTDWTDFTVTYLGKPYPVSTHLLGSFNVYNILAALSVAVEIWINMESAIASVQKVVWVTGRMERIEKNGVHCFVDFAHSPDALEKTLQYLSSIKWANKLITVFWAPGLRDKSKRPIMWAVVDDFSDIIIATDDDPDTENRFTILQELTQNIKKKVLGKDFFIIPERKLAIKFALKKAQAGDVVMFAGKWHETVQLTNLGRRKWSDMEEIEGN
jgi:UDP-N-acetylmuramoyl-L-alanyl-D-glutamate--2,6-diaminopimelate ligase